MDEQPEVIHQQMEETRAALVEKLQVLEGQVAETVQSTSDAVQHTGAAVSETVDAVKETVESVSEKVQETMANVTDTVQESVKSITKAFDLSLQTRRHPWLIVGGAVAVGYVGYNLFDGMTSRPAMRSPEPQRFESSPSAAPAPAPAPSAKPSAASDWFGGELRRLRGLAVGTVMAVIRDLPRQAIPGTVGQRLADEVEVVNNALGGEKIHGPVLPTADSMASHNGGTGQPTEHRERVGDVS